MRSPVPLLIFFLCCLSCHDTDDTYSIDGSAKHIADGEVVTITTFGDGDTLSSLAQCEVKDGRFHVDGIADCGKVAYISCRGTRESAGSLFFIEKGEIEIHFDTVACHVTGTPLNELYSIIEDSIGLYIAVLDKIENRYYAIDGKNDELVHLSVEGLLLQEKLVNYIKGAIENNIHNPLGLYLLAVYNELFSTAELTSLIERIPTFVTNSNIPYYIRIAEAAEKRIKE